MSAPTVPETITRLFESLAPPCHFQQIEQRPAGKKLTPCDQCAKWIVRAFYDCGNTFASAACDHHHAVVCGPTPSLFCLRCDKPEPIHSVTAEAL